MADICRFMSTCDVPITRLWQRLWGWLRRGRTLPSPKLRKRCRRPP